MGTEPSTTEWRKKMSKMSEAMRDRLESEYEASEGETRRIDRLVDDSIDDNFIARMEVRLAELAARRNEIRIALKQR